MTHLFLATCNPQIWSTPATDYLSSPNMIHLFMATCNPQIWSTCSWLPVFSKYNPPVLGYPSFVNMNAPPPPPLLTVHMSFVGPMCGWSLEFCQVIHSQCWGSSVRTTSLNILTVTNCHCNLHQHFYLLSHTIAIKWTTFVNAVNSQSKHFTTLVKPWQMATATKWVQTNLDKGYHHAACEAWKAMTQLTTLLFQIFSPSLIKVTAYVTKLYQTMTPPPPPHTHTQREKI